MLPRFRPVVELLQVYRWLLLLYPRGFRREYGPAMEAAFEQMLRSEYARQGLRGLCSAAVRVAFELGPTLVSEYGSVGRRLITEKPLARVALATVLPLAFIGMLGHGAQPTGDAPTALAWFVCWAVPVLWTSGRGPRSLALGSTGGMTGVWIMLLGQIVITQEPITPTLGPILLLTILGGTVGLILATYVRLVMEGLVLGAGPAGETASLKPAVS